MAENFESEGNNENNAEEKSSEATKPEAEKPIRTEDCEIQVTKVNIQGSGEKYLKVQENPQTGEVRFARTYEEMNKGICITIEKPLKDENGIINISDNTHIDLIKKSEDYRRKRDSKVEAAKQKLGNLKNKIKITGNKDKE